LTAQVRGVDPLKRRLRVALLALALGSAVVALAACWNASRGDGLDVATLPVEMRADYEIFAQRCSKCHSLARPLESGITDDEFWREYFERMRRQSGSGITPADERPVLHFLHYYSMTQVRRRPGGAGVSR
jgi:mono/diheme cytochrome c family protein